MPNKILIRPKLVIVTGRPGSGKTTLSKELGKILHYPVVSRDEIKEGYVNTFKVRHDELPKDTNKTATEIFFKNVDFLLANNITLIAEGAFQHKIWEPELTRMGSYADVFIIICEVDAETAAKRHLKRGLDDPKREYYHGDNRVAHYKKTGVVLPAGKYEALSMEFPTIKVLTQNGYHPELAEISRQIISNQ